MILFIILCFVQENTIETENIRWLRSTYVTTHTKRVFSPKKMGFHFLIDFYIELDVDSDKPIAKVVSPF